MSPNFMQIIDECERSSFGCGNDTYGNYVHLIHRGNLARHRSICYCRCTAHFCIWTRSKNKLHRERNQRLLFMILCKNYCYY